mmetsp:Transcript_35170/g.59272  ORF Transcript_35170/g.59272 Transcript_35170/m.59272 type:complete len:217 (+) Transcript_35170:503-1153(+)
MCRTPSWSSWLRMPDKSLLLDRQNSISARGPASSPSSELSWLFTTSLICRVQWMSVVSSRWTRCFSCAASAMSPISSAGMYSTVFPLAWCVSSVRKAMNLWICPVKSFFTLSGQVLFFNTFGTYTPLMSFSRDSVVSPCSTPTCTIRSMFDTVTNLLGSRTKYSSSTVFLLGLVSEVSVSWPSSSIHPYMCPVLGEVKNSAHTGSCSLGIQASSSK